MGANMATTRHTSLSEPTLPDPSLPSLPHELVLPPSLDIPPSLSPLPAKRDVQFLQTDAEGAPGAVSSVVIGE